jgi:hypothetical protein
MKFICLGYMDEKVWESMSEEEKREFAETCFEYDHELHKNGHIIGGEALQSSRHTATIRYVRGNVSVTDGPFIETKEQIGGILIIEARDRNHAIQLMSNHPSVRMGSIWEVRPAEDISDLVAESERRIKKGNVEHSKGAAL